MKNRGILKQLVIEIVAGCQGTGVDRKQSLLSNSPNR